MAGYWILDIGPESINLQNAWSLISAISNEQAWKIVHMLVVIGRTEIAWITIDYCNFHFCSGYRLLCFVWSHYRFRALLSRDTSIQKPKWSVVDFQLHQRMRSTYSDDKRIRFTLRFSLGSHLSMTSFLILTEEQSALRAFNTYVFIRWGNDDFVILVHRQTDRQIDRKNLFKHD